MKEIVSKIIHEVIKLLKSWIEVGLRTCESSYRWRPLEKKRVHRCNGHIHIGPSEIIFSMKFRDALSASIGKTKKKSKKVTFTISLEQKVKHKPIGKHNKAMKTKPFSFSFFLNPNLRYLKHGVEGKKKPYYNMKMKRNLIIRINRVKKIY